MQLLCSCCEAAVQPLCSYGTATMHTAAPWKFSILTSLDGIRVVGKNEKLESFKLESLKLESFAEVGKSQAKLERTD